MKYCLIGEKLGHSYSREIHCKAGLNYDLVEVKKTDLENFFKTTEYNGFNITIPYKIDAIKYVDSLTLDASLTGAINTVKVLNGKLHAHNTDVDGLNYMINRKGVTLKDKNVMILGGGGTSNTAVALCKREKAKSITVVSRKGEINYQNCYDKLETEIIINATPVGMYPNVEDSILDLSKFSNLIAIFDCIYNPFKTNLILQAEDLDLINSNGLPMLVKQALLSEEFWLDKVISNDVTEKIISEITNEKSNLALYGMASSGKTTLGRIIAKKLNRDFIDTDEYIKSKYNKSPSKIITEKGESEFRKIETEVVFEVSKLSGKVIALGGGAVLSKENQTALKRNSIMALITRDLNLLIDKDRPLSKKVGIKELYESRKPLYDALKDFEIINNGDIEVAVNGVIKEYENTCNKRC